MPERLLQSVQVTASSGLSKSEVERLVAEADEHAKDDRARREYLELHSKCDGLVYSTERTLEEFADSVDAVDRDFVHSALEKARAAMTNENTAELQAAVDAPSGVAYQMTEKLYAALGGDEEGS